MNKSLNIHTKDLITGINAFWLAAYFGHGKTMHELANAGIDVPCVNHMGINALHIACTKNYLNVVKMLIKSNYPLNLQNDQGLTAFQIAAFNGFTEIVKEMMAFAEAKSMNEKKRLINFINRQSNMGALSYAIVND